MHTAKFLEPMDYLAMCFSGRVTANQCTASMSLVTDNRTLCATDYDAHLLRYSTIDREKLPDLVPLDSIVGTARPEIAAELGLEPGTRGRDRPQRHPERRGRHRPFEGTHAAVSVGSTSVMITHLGDRRTDVRHAILSTPGPVPGKYSVMAENGAGGGTLEQFLGNVVYANDRFGELAADDRYALLQRAVPEGVALNLR